MKETRSSFDAANLQQLFDAASSPQAALRTGQAQYLTPRPWAEHFGRLLPRNAQAVLDPQCGDGALLDGYQTWNRTGQFAGVDIDRRVEALPVVDRRRLISANCVDFWQWLVLLKDDIWLPVQVANPPFGITWRLPNGATCESTEYTWKMQQTLAGKDGCGYLIGGADRLERLGVRTHPWTYCWHRIEPEAGVFKDVTIPIAIAHWDASDSYRIRHRMEVSVTSPNPGEVAAQVRSVVQHQENTSARFTWWYSHPMFDHWETLQELARESRRKNLPAHNVTLRPDGRLRCHFSTLDRVRRKLDADDLKPILNLDGCHPLTLTVEVASRRKLAELLGDGTYTIAPEARAAIQSALDETARAAIPLMPPTDFALVAWADELDELTCRQEVDGLPFTPGQSYALDPVDGGLCEFSTPFTQTRRHLDPDTGIEATVVHHCSLSGKDRYLSLVGDDGRLHYFVDRPEHTTLPGHQQPEPDQIHAEPLLWEVFDRPVVPDIATVDPDLFDRIRRALIAQQPC